MNFFKRLFGGGEKSDFDKMMEKQFPKKNYDPEKVKRLEELATPFLKDCTKITVQDASRIPENSNLISQFGGLPYFEKGEEWPKSEEGNSLSFIFQVFNADGIHLPKNIQLIQFYYGFEELPNFSDEDGWKVKIYEKLNPENVVKIERPEDVERPKFCNITFESRKSLPDWETIDEYIEGYTDLAEEIDGDNPWDAHSEVEMKLTGNDNYQSQLGGYPRWVQGDGTPEDENTGRKSELLFQIDSEDNAGLMWGDAGLVYVFYDPVDKSISFELQCH
ncbi:DUF1963 domain-containing protein [Flavobacterium sp.]